MSALAVSETLQALTTLTRDAGLELVLTRFGLVATLPHLFAGSGWSRRIVTAHRSFGIDRPTRKAGIVVQSSILVVDGLSETVEVLRAVFEPRGHAVNRVRHSQLPGGSSWRPSVVVWHANESDETVGADRFAGIPRVVIGRASVTESSNATRRFAQPFEYSELLSAIDALLSADVVA